MSELKTISKNTLFLTLAQIANALLSILSVMALGRYLRVEEYGRYAYSLALAGILVVFTDMGMRTLMTREVSRHKEMAVKYLGNYLLIKGFFTLVACLGADLYLFHHFREVASHWPLIVISDCILLIALNQGNVALLRAYARMEFEMFNTVIGSCLTVTCFWLFLSHQMGLAGVAGAILITSIFQLSFLTASAWRIAGLNGGRIFAAINPRYAVHLFAESIPFAATAIFAIIYFRIDTIMLESMRGIREVGLYNSAYRILEFLMVFPASFIYSVFPNFSVYYEESREKFLIAYAKCLKFLFLVGLPAALGLTLVADPLIRFLWTDKFTGAGLALKILSWALFFSFMNFIQGTVLVTMNKQVITSINALFCAVLNIGLNLWLIPRWGLYGASAATVATEILLFALGVAFAWRYGVRLRLGSYMLKALLAVFLMALCVLCVRQFGLWAMLGIGVLIYLISIFALKTLDRDERRLVLGLLRH